MDKNTTPDFKDMYNTQSEEYSSLTTLRLYLSLIDPHLFSQIGDVKGKTVLDLACGQGNHLQFLEAQSPKELIGVDISEEQINIAKKSSTTPKINFITEDMGKADFYKTLGEKKFDIIFSVWGVYYMENMEKLKTFFEGIYKMLVPGGKVFFYMQDDEVVEKEGIAKIFNGKIETLSGDWKDQSTIKITFSNPPLEIVCYLWLYPTVEKLLKEAGFVDVGIDTSYDETQGLKGFSESEWAQIKKYKPFYLVTATKIN